MAESVVGLNPDILRWARERTGLSVADVAKSLDAKGYKKKIEAIKKWETGLGAPTYSQLEKLSYKIYKRPLALFFFPEIPQETEIEESFRTLPQLEIDNLSSDTRFALRQAEARQIALRELCEGKNPFERYIFRELRVTPRKSISNLAKEVRDFLEVDLATQMSWRSTSDAMRVWRNAVEASGVFVFKRSFKQKEISGFCLVDTEFPVIYINNSTAHTRQIFTLFHELAHILLNANAITKLDSSFIDSLTGSAREIEQFCDRFAAEFLVPSEDFDSVLIPDSVDEEQLSFLSKRYSVSREVILRKLLDMGIVEEDYYARKTDQWNRDYQKYLKGKKSGGQYYPTQAVYLGTNYLNLAFKKYYAGNFGITRLADFLDVKIKGVASLEEIAIKGSLSR